MIVLDGMLQISDMIAMGILAVREDGSRFRRQVLVWPGQTMQAFIIRE